MLRPVTNTSKSHFRLSRRIHSSPIPQLQSQTVLPRFRKPPVKVRAPQAYRYEDDVVPQKVRKVSIEEEKEEKRRRAKRNQVGVQLLSRELHKQIFKDTSFPEAPKQFVAISTEHLKNNGLDPVQSSTLDPVEFTLPPLQGNNLAEHFYRIGTTTAEPYLSLCNEFAAAELPPPPEFWQLRPGWTKYYYEADGSSYFEPVDYPMHNGKAETLLSFDVETMPNSHKYAIMACAASPNGWYAWISPWIIDRANQSPTQLIPLGPPDVARIVVGHNVAYDRARIKEEYSLAGTKTRFMDTMALHVAIKGISSHQRPAWMKHRKNKQEQVSRQQEIIEAVKHYIFEAKAELEEESNSENAEKLREAIADAIESLPGLQQSLLKAEEAMDDNSNISLDSDDTIQTRWEDITSANSLIDVAKLHCGIEISKEIRNDFMTSTPDAILAGLSDYLTYCASDVRITHSVFKKVFPGFREACPHPVSFSGITTMGSGLLPVNQEWEKYLERAEGVYQKMERKIKDDLANLARDIMQQYAGKSAGEINDPWLSQLDWSPKIASKTRGVLSPAASNASCELNPDEAEPTPLPDSSFMPYWYAKLAEDPFSKLPFERTVPLLLRLKFNDHPMQYTPSDKWHYLKDGEITQLDTSPKLKISSILSVKHAKRFLADEDMQMTSCNRELAMSLCQTKNRTEERKLEVLALADAALHGDRDDPFLRQLDWTPVDTSSGKSGTKLKKVKTSPVKKTVSPKVYWPKWYWELTKPKKDMPPGSLDISIRNQITPILLRMSWHGYPLFHSREHGWMFRALSGSLQDERLRLLSPVDFSDAADDVLSDAVLRDGCKFFKLPHKDGDKANVGSPLSKTFMKYAQDGILSGGAGDAINTIVDISVQCSYWISARDRILNQMVHWQSESDRLAFPSDPENEKWGIILPHVITMGTVTRRAIEKTWLTASNAKKNRVGSELKSMVRAPPGYAIVGADVDSEELWISSCMGDAQFGFHGATAIGWMTLEGTKAAGTDLHSKTAQILGISRDQAKVFNYSRIYGAGMRHAVLLLLQGNPGMLKSEAQKLAENLYASTKGKNTHRTDIFGRKFWYGGSESFLFNKLEDIASSDKPQTPALGCGITSALMKEYLPTDFGSDYLPSRINWVVQSSGVDYLHLLIVSMNHILQKYDIQARYLISVHDEVRYLVKEEDRFRAALALQIANMWTRCMFAYKLGMDDLPQGVAFFSAVDIDHVLRKEVDMPCITPSNPTAIPLGESYGIEAILEKTGGSLLKDGKRMPDAIPTNFEGTLDGYKEADCLSHRALSPQFLRAQATKNFATVKHCAKEASQVKAEPPKEGQKINLRRNGVDWGRTIGRLKARAAAN